MMFIDAVSIIKHDKLFCARAVMFYRILVISLSLVSYILSFTLCFLILIKEYAYLHHVHVL